MGRRGPPPTPGPLLLLRNSRALEKRKNEPTGTPGIPECPDYVEEGMRCMWDFLCAELSSMGILATIDQMALGRYVVLHARWQKMERFVKQYGETFPMKDAEGAVVNFQVFPQVYLANNLAAQLSRLEQQFALTPAARAGIGLLNARAEKTQGASGSKATKEKTRAFRGAS